MDFAKNMLQIAAAWHSVINFKHLLFLYLTMDFSKYCWTVFLQLPTNKKYYNLPS